jgi:hypothetical protein
MGRRDHYCVYVIELSKDVLGEKRFIRCNPDYRDGKPCVYVGMTGLDPDLRFDKHKAGIQSNRYVQRYGLRLLPDLYEAYNPMSYGLAQETPDGHFKFPHLWPVKFLQAGRVNYRVFGGFEFGLLS